MVAVVGIGPTNTKGLHEGDVYVNRNVLCGIHNTQYEGKFIMKTLDELGEETSGIVQDALNRVVKESCLLVDKQPELDDDFHWAYIVIALCSLIETAKGTIKNIKREPLAKKDVRDALRRGLGPAGTEFRDRIGLEEW
jgi:hypothetical protein